MQKPTIKIKVLSSVLVTLAILPAVSLCLSGCDTDTKPSKQVEIRKQMDAQKKGMQGNMGAPGGMPQSAPQ